MQETSDAYQLKADLPGVKKEDVTLDVDGNIIRIGAKIGESESKDEESEAGPPHCPPTHLSTVQTYTLEFIDALDDDDQRWKNTSGSGGTVVDGTKYPTPSTQHPIHARDDIDGPISTTASLSLVFKEKQKKQEVKTKENRPYETDKKWHRSERREYSEFQQRGA